MSTPGGSHTQLRSETSETATAAPELKNADRSRRAFLFKLSLFLNGIVGTILAVPILGYILGPALKRDSSYRSWVSLGFVKDFPEGETRLVNFRNPFTTGTDGVTGNVPCWVRHIHGTQFQVFAINCAHLGCPVRWFAQSRLFMCPCHGGVYYADGSRASGPPERGLFEYHYSIVSNNLMINAGEMPTLSNEACLKKRLVQIESSDENAPDLTAKPRSFTWPS
jgi:menaquinol-cytochrome c reductase iron-sulfur subunit